jgi:predicted ATPase/DNA-binding CsgD family transcriptional regulator
VTAREAEILAAVGRRLTNREIAARLSISVRTVESHVSALLRKLGLPGRPELVRLAQQLTGEQLIPASTTSFVGRDGELAELSAMLAASTLVCLVGPAGCGKTRLALEAARRWRGEPRSDARKEARREARGEARIVELESATGLDVSALIAAGLGIGYEARDLVPAARVALAGSDVLLVVDNCEHVLGPAGEVLGSLARGVLGLRVLATSREPLGLDVEHVLALRPLGLPAGFGAQDVRASEAGQLFLDRALAASPRFRLDEASAPHVAAICHRLDGLPLAIELAAARVRNFDVMELAEALRHRLGVLERPGQAGRHRSLHAAIEWSWQLLGDTERHLLRRLAVLPGEFTLALAETAAGSRATIDVRSVLWRLVEQSLVSMRLPEGEPARYWLLDVIRAFAREHADPAADEQVARAHALFFCDAASGAARAHYHPTQGTPPAEVDEPNLLAALAWSAAHDPGLADRLLVSISQLADLEPSRQTLEVIYEVAAGCPPHWSSEALARAANAVAFLRLDHAEQLARKSSLAATTERDKAFASWAAGWIHAYRHEESAAVNCLDVAISYARSAPDPWLEASALQARGVARIKAQDAFADWEQAINRFVVAGDLTHASNVRYMIANNAVDTRTRLQDVPIWLDECESYAASRGYKHELAHSRRVRATYERIQQRPDTAQRLLDAVLPVFRQAGDFRCIARTLLELAQLAKAGDPAAAAGLLLQSLRAAAIASGPATHAQILGELTTAAAAADDRVLSARCLGALDAVDNAAAAPGAAEPALPPADSALERTLRAPAYATYVSEGHAGGIDLITALYPR